MPHARTIERLIDEAEAEASREPFPVDEPVYQKAGRDPSRPILFAGALDAPVAILARDLGRDEVAAAQPLIGAGGKLVRAGIVAAHGGGEPEEALKFALLTNTVPFKPPGNKAYSESVRARFRPYVAELLARFWSGSRVLTLGTEAFRWFEPYAEGGTFPESAATDARFDAEYPCRLPIPGGGDRAVIVAPLPHPSPLNRRWYSRFPEMLARRLAEGESSA
ncbi:uracil-DNA glycosylase family protein [Paludisphaera sp.]|uniref:uracil-DNA glycosylase family protein n=1 Tax=Paludisphaera sp. TaxID=2017432 RepID=UPI00301C94C1